MLVGEGVFTTLSATERFGLPGWALLSTRNLRAWSPPEGVRSILIAADRGKDGEEVFSEGRSLILKSLKVTRVYDAKNNALVYLGHASELTQGSGKMSLSVVPLSAP